MHTPLEKAMIFLTVCLTAHFVADFVLQSRWMARGKSGNLYPLLIHIMVYTTALTTFLLPLAGICPVQGLILFGLINGGLHLVTDFFTSKASRWFYANKMEHEFWCVIGFDQLLHAYGFVLAYWWVLT